VSSIFCTIAAHCTIEKHPPPLLHSQQWGGESKKELNECTDKGEVEQDSIVADELERPANHPLEKDPPLAQSQIKDERMIDPQETYSIVADELERPANHPFEKDPPLAQSQIKDERMIDPQETWEEGTVAVGTEFPPGEPASTSHAERMANSDVVEGFDFT
jgi:hypothetical protein